MHPPVRTQANPNKDYYLRKTAIRFDQENDPDARSLTRQEDEPAANINNILKSFGIHQPMRTGYMGSIDFQMDLRDAIELQKAAARMYDSMPDELAAQFPTPEDLQKGIADGTLEAAIKKASEPPAPAPTPTPTPTPTPNG